MPNPNVIWQTKRPNDFYKQVGDLPDHIKKNLSRKMKEMVRSADPTKLGEWKPNLKFGGAWVADLNEGYRLSYIPDFDTRIILIIRAGKHKFVQGK